MTIAIALALAVSSPTAISAPTAAPAQGESDTVVITATLPALQRALEKCEQGGCTPRQDAMASIRYAEAVFRNGRYQQARYVLQKAIARNKHAESTDPDAVAALYEATVTAALHDGEQDVARRAGFERARILRENEPAEGIAALEARLDTIDLIMHAGRVREAVAQYGYLAQRAAAANQPEIAAAATLRQAAAYYGLHREREARKSLAPIIANDQLPAAFRIAAHALMAHFDRERGDPKAVDKLIAYTVQSGALAGDNKGPMLLWQPPLPDPTNIAHVDRDNLYDQTSQLAAFTGVEWADIGFQIRPDGTVDAPEILRSSHGQAWARPVMAMIAQRRYAPPGNNALPLYRIERWTLTADYRTAVGSLIRRRGHNPHYEQADLTPSEPGPTS